MKKNIVIANASGFWGDEAAAIRRQIMGGHIDYLTMDYLAEITMIILGRQIAKKPDYGYAGDFVTNLEDMLGEIANRGITVITNAGGINSQACAKALESIIEKQGLDLPVAAIDGDNLMPKWDELEKAGCGFKHLETGEPLGVLREKTAAANAYIGAKPIVAALQKGARIVVTGRCYDAASVVAPFVHEFGWSWDEYDKLASALLAGHLIECGTQSTGGNYTRWEEVPSYLQMGYPLVEASPDGSFVLTKHPQTGGLVNVRTAKEQILYEIGNPRAYQSPDVIADFTSFSLMEEGVDRVRISGVKGRMPTADLKVSLNYAAGHKILGMLVVSGPKAVQKGKVFAEMFWDRVGTDGFIDRRTDYVGYSACWGESAAPPVEPNEIILRFAARAETKDPLIRLSKELAGLILAGPPGVTVFGGRPAITPAFGFWPALISKDKVTARLTFRCQESFYECDDGPYGELKLPEIPLPSEIVQPQRTVAMPLRRIAHARSGDKGDLANIGVIALLPEFYIEILREVTVDKVANFFASNVKGPVEKHCLDNLNAVNFVLHGALNGGGTVSLLLDNQGKTLSQALLNMVINVNEELLSLIEGTEKN
ncbi:MAG: acyclic terpene utilization AtuA family protein [Desulforhopalus sp.]